MINFISINILIIVVAFKTRPNGSRTINNEGLPCLRKQRSEREGELGRLRFAQCMLIGCMVPMAK
jgi:hypothetical protein